jgi:hypothetical protein
MQRLATVQLNLTTQIGLTISPVVLYRVDW